MTKFNSFLVLIMLAFGLFLGLSVFPVVSLAQTDKTNNERAKEVEDDDDDENLTDADRREVKLSLEAARKIALDKVPGTVIDEELEREHGRLQYAFDIRTAEGRVYDVEISAVTGEVFQAEPDDDDDDDNKASTKARPAKHERSTAKTPKPAKTKKT